MDTIRLPQDFKEFLNLLNSKSVEYLLIGGYEVGAHGYVRATGDIDFWVAINSGNAEKIVEVFKDFGFGSLGVEANWFLVPSNILRVGAPPLKIEVLTSVSGVQFDECFREREVMEIEGIKVNVIGLKHLRLNKAASGRYKDLDDLQNLPEAS